MPDDSLDVFVRIRSDSAGGREAAGTLDQVSAATRRGTAANEEHGKSFLHAESSGRAFHRVLHGLTEESPLLGLAIRMALSPVSGLLIGAAMAVGQLREAEKRAEEQAKAAGEASAEAFKKLHEDANKAVSDAEEAAEGLAREFLALAQAQDSAESKTKRVQEALAAEKDAITQVMKAREQLELSQARDDTEREGIKRKYGARGRNLEVDVGMEGIRRLEQALKEAEERQKTLLAKAGGEAIFGSREAAARAELERQKAGADAALKGAETTVASKPHWWQFWRFLAPDMGGGGAPISPFGPSGGGSALATRDFAEERSQEAMKNLDMLAKVAKETHDNFAKLRDELTKNQQFIEKSRTELEERRAKLPLTATTAVQLNNLEAMGGLGAEAGRGMPRLAGLAGAGDLPGFATALAALGMWPARLAELTRAIQAGDAAWLEATRMLESRQHNTESRQPTRMLPGGG